MPGGGPLSRDLILLEAGGWRSSAATTWSPFRVGVWPVGLAEGWATARRPGCPAVDHDANERARGCQRRVLRVLLRQSRKREPPPLRIDRQNRRVPVDPDPPQSRPVVVVLVDEHAHPRVRLDVRQPTERTGRFWLRIHRSPHVVSHEGEDDRNKVRATFRGGRGKPPDTSLLEPFTRPLVHAPTVS